jgi:hypothetical protein
LKCLEKAEAEMSGESSARAGSLLKGYRDGVTLLGLELANDVLKILEDLNRSFQSRSSTVSGLLGATKVACTQIQNLRCSDKFGAAFDRVTQQLEHLQMEPLSLPRLRQLPKRFSSGSEAFHASTAKDHYWNQYAEYVDCALVQLKERFTKGDINRYIGLE